MYNYIIVGAGSAGCVLANRLSADPGNRVCLIEAGSRDRNPLIHVPLGLAFLARVKSLNWGYTTAPNPAWAIENCTGPAGARWADQVRSTR